LFRPAEVHAEEHFGPVLGFGAAGARLYGDDGVEAIVFTGEQGSGFQLGDVGIGGGDFFGDVFEERIALGVVFFFLRQAQVGFDIALFGVESYFGVYAVFDDFALLQGGLRFFLVLPEIGVAGFCFEIG
jgi:hypothetical protein